MLGLRLNLVSPGGGHVLLPGQGVQGVRPLTPGVLGRSADGIVQREVVADDRLLEATVMLLGVSLLG